MNNKKIVHIWYSKWVRKGDGKWKWKPRLAIAEDSAYVRSIIDNALATKDATKVRDAVMLIIGSPMLYSRSRPAKYRKPRVCPVCGNVAVLTRDHWVPRAAGGTGARSNIVWMCSPCNNTKGAKLPADAGIELLPRDKRR